MDTLNLSATALKPVCNFCQKSIRKVLPNPSRDRNGEVTFINVHKKCHSKEVKFWKKENDDKIRIVKDKILELEFQLFFLTTSPYVEK